MTSSTDERALLDALRRIEELEAQVSGKDVKRDPVRIPGDNDRPQYGGPFISEPNEWIDDAKPYWCGTLPGCPLQNVTLGGFDFPSFSEKLQLREDTGAAKTDRNKHSGRVHWLTEEGVKKIREAALRKVFRKRGGVWRLESTDGQMNRPYMASSKDIPAAAWCYMVDVSDQEVNTYAVGTPVPMAVNESEEPKKAKTKKTKTA
jgi:hypothetical protein